MKRLNLITSPERKPGFVLLSGLCLILLQPAGNLDAFTPLNPIPAPGIEAFAPEYPGGNHSPRNLVDNNPQTEYSSASLGTETFVVFSLDETKRIGAFRHQDRNDPATIKRSLLHFYSESGELLKTYEVEHPGKRAGETFFVFPEPVTARKIRWEITELGPHPYTTVGGAEISFFEAGKREVLPSRTEIRIHQKQILRKEENGLFQPIEVLIDYPYAETLEVIPAINGREEPSVSLKPGTTILQAPLPATVVEIPLEISLSSNGTVFAQTTEIRKPVREMTVYILPHSHTDIGYTEIQTDIEEKQVNNLLAGIECAEASADYPEDARFVWNVEVLWAADLFLNRMGPGQQQRFLDAVRSGKVSLCGMYLNELTGLCRPEELVRLFRFATRLAEVTEVPIDSAMISDVPGYTWGTVPAMNQAGIRYFSVAPNYFDRIGNILVEWENKPFWWIGPDKKSRVLVWIPFWGYAMSHRYGHMSAQLVSDFQEGLTRRQYPYDIAYVRWAGHGDNAVPEPSICDFVRDWNQQYAWPRFIISSTSEAFRAFEERYGNSIPEVYGDWTPYWEDGAGSSALETGMNRESSDRLAQSEALWAILEPQSFPSGEFDEAWKKVLLYSEHTWGAWCSVSQPNRKETLEQWSIKRSYAVTADFQSRSALSRAQALAQDGPPDSAIDIYNTSSWNRSGLVTIPRDFCEGLNRVSFHDQPIASQRLANGELVIQAEDIPPFSGRRYQLEPGSPHTMNHVIVSENSLENENLKVVVNDQTGAIESLIDRSSGINYADPDAQYGINEYLYFNGDDPSTAVVNGPVQISLGERGPLLASIVITSEAPGCQMLRRELRLAAGADHIEIINTVDKRRLVADSYHSPEGKESLNFAFPFNVPDGEVFIQVPFGVFSPDKGQIPSACKNWFTVGRWADVSNSSYGISLVSIDAPLLQVGELSANLLNSQSDPSVWRREVGPTQQLYSWAMNNHWGTNYRAYQEGPVVFQYILNPHGPLNPAATTRLAVEKSQPLIPIRGRGDAPEAIPVVTISDPNILATAMKPADDGHAIILRLWCASDENRMAELKWEKFTPSAVYISNTSEKALQPAPDKIDVPAWGMVTLRAELP